MKYRTETIRIDTAGGRLKLLILTPRGKAERRPGILWIHGGGYVTGMAEMVHFSRAAPLVGKYGAVVVSPAYRRAGTAPYPAALEDCHAALCYLRDHAEALGVRSDQLMVGGESAGGGLTAALCMYEKDIGGVKIACQMPLYPMLDCKETETSRDNRSPVWNTRRNRAAWRKYLRGLTGEPPCYASPAARINYAGLPPAYTFVCTAEPFYAETVSFVTALKRAGVEAELDCYPGLYHAFDMLMPWRAASRLAAARFEAWFGRAAERYFAPQS